MPDCQAVLTERLNRQGLTATRKDERGYLELFSTLQPVSTTTSAYPGSPPALPHRTSFDCSTISEDLRRERRIVKGRFVGGTVGYVLADDLQQYANAFCRPLTDPTPTQQAVYEAVCVAGPLTPRQVKEETGLLNKHIMPALHRLQTAFLVYEDQTETDWERSWYAFESEWPDITLDADRQLDDVCMVLGRFLHAHVFATFEQFKGWSRLPVRLLRQALQQMEQQQLVQPISTEGLGDGWIGREDVGLRSRKPRKSVFVLSGADGLVRSHTEELKRTFGKRDVLAYLLIDGAFDGLVCGRWRIGPHDVDDIVLQLPEAERTARRKQILTAVKKSFAPPRHQILRYDGEKL